MKTIFVASALLGACAAASAQSSVTLFGVVDATLQRGSGGTSSVTRLGSGALSSTKLGLRGVEDLGGGLAAAFWLESGLNADNGTGTISNPNNQATTAAPAGTQGLTFNRRSTVSIGNAMGELRFGRDYTPHYLNIGLYDPFGNVGVGVVQALGSTLAGFTGIRASNSVSYLYGHPLNADPVGTSGPNFQVMWFAGENNSNAPNPKDGGGYSVRIGYNTQAFAGAVASGLTRNLTGDIRSTNVGGTYNFGVAKLFALYQRDAVDRGATGTGYLLGATVPFAVHAIRMSYSTYKTTAVGTPETRKLALGYVHNLSKRTALYATAAHLKNYGPANQALNGAVTPAGGSSTGFDLGLKHSF